MFKVSMSDILLRIPKVKVLYNKKNVYRKELADLESVTKIETCLNGVFDWIVFIDGNTWRKFVRGFAFCKSGIIFRDDNAEVMQIFLQDIGRLSISHTSKSLLINGKCISLGENSQLVFECIVLIRNIISQKENFTLPIKVADLSVINWFLGYNGEIIGPLSKESIQNKLKDNEYNLNELQVWNKKMSEWKFIEELSKDFALPAKQPLKGKVYEKLDELEVQCDINSCSVNELLHISGISKDKAEDFFDRRNRGYRLKDIYEFQAEFDLSPHELEKMKDKLVFRQQKYSSARRVDM